MKQNKIINKAELLRSQFNASLEAKVKEAKEIFEDNFKNIYNQANKEINEQ